MQKPDRYAIIIWARDCYRGTPLLAQRLPDARVDAQETRPMAITAQAQNEA